MASALDQSYAIWHASEEIARCASAPDVLRMAAEALTGAAAKYLSLANEMECSDVKPTADNSMEDTARCQVMIGAVKNVVMPVELQNEMGEYLYDWAMHDLPEYLVWYTANQD